MTKYTHGHHETVLRSHRWRTASNSAAYLLPHLRAGDRLLDVGAGPGTITADFAAVVRDVTATEVGPDEVALARQTARERGVTNIEFEVADVHRLPFADDTFDVAHAHQVLQHVADPVQALREMRRVTKPGGLVAARDGDYAAMAWYPELPELDEWLALYDEAAITNGGEPNSGRRLLSWAQQAGFQDVTATASAWCFANPDDRAWWGGMWADRILVSAMAEQLMDSGMATRGDLERISAAWRAWADAPDGWMSILHGEIVARVP